MTTKRGLEIERFYWLIINLAGKAFGFLLLVGGGLFLLSMLVELLRDGTMAWDGRMLTTWPEQWPVLLGGFVMTLCGALLIKVLPVKKSQPQR